MDFMYKQVSTSDESLPAGADVHWKAGTSSHGRASDVRCGYRNLRNLLLVLSWGLTGLLCLVTGALLFERASNGRARYFSTDMADARDFIEYEQVRFTGALTFDEDAPRVYRVHDAEVEYFGPPSPEIEGAWSALLDKHLFVMTPEEAAPFAPELTPLPSTGQTIVELYMFHTLHCVNSIRKALTPILYPGAKHPSDYLANSTVVSEQDHLEHCMDLIRQSIQCGGDFSPSPFYSKGGLPVYVGKGAEHTCRKTSSIRNWISKRRVEIPVGGHVHAS